jgi:hypothetical protein
MFKNKHKYQVVFTDGNSIIVYGYDIWLWDDDDQTKGDICISGSRNNNDVAWFRKENVKYIVKIS